MKLYLVRHGDSLPSDRDPNQPLSEKGKEETKAVALFLKSNKIEIDEIMHSSKLRAKQTAEILSKILAPDLTLIQEEGLKPMDPIEPLLQKIDSFDRNVLIVSHLPFLEKLATVLLTGVEQISPINFCGSCFVCIEGEHRSWKIAWIVSPSLCNAHLIQKQA